MDEFGNPVESAGPSFPVEVSGWREELPAAGDEVLEVLTEVSSDVCKRFLKYFNTST